MYRIILIVMMLILAVSCEDKRPDEAPSEDPTPITDPVSPTPSDPPVEPDPGPDPSPEPNPTEPNPEPIPEPVPPEPTLEESFSVNVSFHGNMATSARRTKYLKAILLVKDVVKDPAFKSKILSYDSSCTTNKFYQSSDTRTTVYRKILEGAETLQPTKDNEMDVEVEFYYAASSTVGYTYPSSKRIWVNTKFFDGYTPRSVAANLFHEWLHKLGYKHDSTATPCRPYTVPYAIGYMVRDIGKKYE